eukprot:2141298-Rhodomonas_salina.1
MEQIDSTLAQQLWMNDPENRQYLNKIAVLAMAPSYALSGTHVCSAPTQWGGGISELREGVPRGVGEAQHHARRKPGHVTTTQPSLQYSSRKKLFVGFDFAVRASKCELKLAARYPDADVAVSASR